MGMFLRLLISLILLLEGGMTCILAQELPITTLELIEREYFSTPQSSEESCLTACSRIQGICNTQRITQLALNIQQCQDAVIGHAEWVNSDPQRRYALFPTGSGRNLNATGK